MPRFHSRSPRAGLRAGVIAILLGVVAVAAGCVPGSGGTVYDITCPVTGTVHFTDDYGLQPDGHFHQGIDIIAPEWRVNVAAVGGIVHDRNDDPYGYGLYVDLSGDDGNMYRYAHLEFYGIGDGQRVARGDQVGFTGDTGDATGFHTHFEIHPGGGTATVDPYPSLNQACTNRN